MEGPKTKIQKLTDGEEPQVYEAADEDLDGEEPKSTRSPTMLTSPCGTSPKWLGTFGGGPYKSYSTNTKVISCIHFNVQLPAYSYLFCCFYPRLHRKRDGDIILSE